MLVDIKIPALAESVTEATLGSWLKKVGDAVTEGEPVIEIETDKVVLEITAPSSGILTEILQNENAVVPSNAVIGRIDDSKTVSTAENTETSQNNEASGTAEKAYASEKRNEDAERETDSDSSAPAKTSPAVRKLLSEHHLTADQVAATGKSNRITKQDVLNTASSGTTDDSERTSKSPAPVSSDDLAQNERVPMSALRKRVAQRLVGAQQEYAMLTTFNEVNMSRVLELRDRYKDSFEKTHDIKLGFMSFFVLAAVEALKEFPIVNASVDENEVVYHSYIDIGIAVSAPKGLVVPVVRDADQKTMAQIEREIAEYADKARQGTLALEDISGGTFTITNGGIFGSMMSTPIINPPQSAILGMHSIQERPIVENGEIVARPMMYLALTYDHRIIDGREAVLFLKSIKHTVEDPSRLLLHV